MNQTHDLNADSWIEISKPAILKNFDHLSTFGADHLIPVIKANAYGHGLEEVAEILKSRSFPYLAVDNLAEAIRIRKVSDQPILIMGVVDITNLRKIKLVDLAFVVFEKKMVDDLDSLGQKIAVHLEIDTGLKRHGVEPNKAADLAKYIEAKPNLILEGLMSQLADAGNPDSTFTKKQVELFDQSVETILSSGLQPTYIHLAKTVAMARERSKYANTDRPGDGIIGINTVDQSDPARRVLDKLEPALQLKSKVTVIKTLQSGEPYGYGLTFTAQSTTKLGILPLGYFDGLTRSLSNAAKLTIAGRTAPIVGVIGMNHTAIKVDDDIKPGQEVIVISNEPSDQNSVMNLAKSGEVYPYELVCRLSENLPRIIVD